MRQKQPIGHNHERKIANLIRKGKMRPVTGVHGVTVKHDNHCGIFIGGRCNCNPDIYLNGRLIR